MGAEHSHDFSHASRSLSHATDDIFGCCDAKKVEPAVSYQKRQVQVHQNHADHAGQEFVPFSVLNSEEGKWVPIPRGNQKEIEASLPVVDHPHLSMYFLTLLKATDPAKMDTYLPTSRVDAESLRMLRIHASEAFRHHDLDSNGVLEGDESKVFFAHYVECLMLFVQSSMESAFKEQVKAATTKVYLDQVHSEVNKQTGDFNREKRKRFATAFAVVDVNRDGRLEEKEVVDALTPGHRTNEAFHQALGLSFTHIKVPHRDKTVWANTGHMSSSMQGQHYGHAHHADAHHFSHTMPVHHERDARDSSAHHMHQGGRNAQHDAGHHGSPIADARRHSQEHGSPNHGSPTYTRPGSPIGGARRNSQEPRRHSQEHNVHEFRQPVAARESSDWGDILGGFVDLHQDYHHHRRAGRGPNKDVSVLSILMDEKFGY